MSLSAQLRNAHVALRSKLELCNARYGATGRLAMVWQAVLAKDYTDKLIEHGPIQQASETTLHSFTATDLTLTLDNQPATWNEHGFWDGDHTAPADALHDVSPVEDILTRVSVSAQEADGSWGAWYPLFTGLVDELVTDNDTGQAQMSVLGFGSFLAGESAEDVKLGDSWYSQISINRAVRLLLTQKDRWAPIYSGDVLCYISARSATTITVQRYMGVWSPDLSGLHTNGVLAGYCLVIRTGSGAGKVATISSSVENGSSTSVATLALFVPTSEGIEIGETCVVTGYCHPFLVSSGINEISGATIDPVRQIPTQDGRWDLSIWGRPPEDGSVGLTRALAHDGTYTWLGVENKIYRHDVTTDTYTLVVELPATLITRRAFYDATGGYVCFIAWATDTTSATVVGYMFKVSGATMPGQLWTTDDAAATLSTLFPGDRLFRRGHQSSMYGRYVGHPTGQINAVAFAPQDLYFFGNVPLVSGIYCKAKYLHAPTADPDIPVPAVAPYTISTTLPWTYVRISSTWNPTPWHVSTHLCGSYQFWHDTNGRAVYYWEYIADRFILRKYTISTNAISTFYDTSSYEVPAALWKTGGTLYWVTNTFGSDTSYVQNRISCHCHNGSAHSVIWQSPNGTGWYEGYIFTGATYDSALGAVGCIMAAQNPDDAWYASSPHHKKFLLVKNLGAAAFWTDFDSGANIIYVSRNPWVGFTNQASTGQAWFVHYGYNTLWTTKGGVTGRVVDRVTVPGDKALASQIAFTTETNPRVLGVSCGDIPDLRPGVADTGKCYLWQFAPWLTPRIDLADFSGLSRYEALTQIAELADFVTRFDESGQFIFQKRPDTGSAGTVTIDGDTTTRKVTKRRDRKSFYNRVECRAGVPTLGKPDVKYVPVRYVEATGDPVEFNGTIEVRQVGVDCRRVVLICVAGNYDEFGGATSTTMDGTYWRAYCQMANPQYLNGGAAIEYPVDGSGNSGWWSLKDSTNDFGLLVKLTPSPEGPVGFTAGDSIEITLPGLTMEDAPDAKAFAEDSVSIALRRVRSYQVDNQLMTAARAPDLCKFLLGQLSPESLEIEVESELFPMYQPLLTADCWNTRLGFDSTFVVKNSDHNVNAGLTRITLREWPAVVLPVVQAMPIPVLPAAEPA